MVYQGPISWGAWVDAKDLEPGYRLLNDDDSWAEVVSVKPVTGALTAYNLTVDGFHTFYVAANENAAPVWVHNACRPPPNPYGRRGNPETRAHIETVADRLDESGFDIDAGARGLPEEYLPPINGGTRGGSYPDITATNRVTGETIRVNTVDTLADGVTPTTRELRNAIRITDQTGQAPYLIPKPR